jgi:NhaA family Na+:H+ antiporter
MLAPVESFLAIEAASGIILLCAAVIALAWANSRFFDSYQALWHTPIGLKLGAWSFERDLHFWINDGLMTIFFFVVGLEIRREIHRGELSELRRASLPLAAALGGMLVPAAIFLALNRGLPTASGWGVPMATDIAFAVGVLALLGKRVPPALRVLLLALAVIDDVGAILVIAFFYSSGIEPWGLALVGAGMAWIIVMKNLGVRSALAYVPAGTLVWAGAYTTGVHPTLAGVVVGLVTPVHGELGPHRFVAAASERLESLRRKSADPDHREEHLVHDLEKLRREQREAISPVERLQHSLHGWVAFAIMPIFALANAGVRLGAASFEGAAYRLALGIGLGLVVGKAVGVLGTAWLASKLGLARLPKGVSWMGVLVVGMVAGIGFTMSIFIAGLAFPAGAFLETSKLAILVGSAIAALLGLGLGRATLKAPGAESGAARTAFEAETSTEA